MTDPAGQSIALSLGVSALVTVVCRRIGVPALLPLICVGLGLGVSGLGVIEASSLGGGLKGIITVAIGLLIYEGALHLNKEELSRAPRAVWGLLTVGAVITWIGAAAGAHHLLGMSWSISALLGATVIVTGPTVVQPILRMLHISPRAHTVLAAEAVLIDPIGVVATVTTLEVIRLNLSTTPEMSQAGEVLWFFAKPLLGGAGVGILMGLAGIWLLRYYSKSGKIESPLLNLLAVGVCMTCVGIGEAITPEGGLAAVTICGVMMARARVMGATELRSFKELLAVMLVGTLFVLLSSRFEVSQLRELTWREGAFVLVLLFAVRPLVVAASTYGSTLTLREKVFAGTFAPRGIVALSVAAVAATDLRAHLMDGPGAPETGAAAGIIADVQRLEPVVFLAIAGTVLLGSTFSPLLAWAMRLRAGEGSSLIIVGGHPLGIALARKLRECGVDCRIIDSNEQRAAVAAVSGADAIAGDATDARWMDDIGIPHGAGWLLAWTGNHDVDQLAARWAVERFGEGHTAIWSTRPVRGPLERYDIGAGETITQWLDQFGDGLVAVAHSPEAARLDRVIACVCGGRFGLHGPVNKHPSGQGETIFIGLKRVPSGGQTSGGSWAILEPRAEAEHPGGLVEERKDT